MIAVIRLERFEWMVMICRLRNIRTNGFDAMADGLEKSPIHPRRINSGVTVFRVALVIAAYIKYVAYLGFRKPCSRNFFETIWKMTFYESNMVGAIKITTAAFCLLLLSGGLGLCWGKADPLPAADAVRVVKSERKLYLLRDGQAYKTYRISLGSRPVGDKVRQGDKRTPEGRYIIDWRNLESRYHRALHISYPNAADRREAQAMGVDPGGMIMIHGLPNKTGDDTEGYVGLDWTDGCIAVTNQEIEELLQVIKDGTPIQILP